MMPLTMGEAGTEYEVKKITGNEKIQPFLGNLGFYTGGKVKIVSAINGNMIVQVKEARLALDSAMARRVMV